MASKRRLRKSACGPKIRYPDQEAARGAWAQLASRIGDRAHGLQAYRCRWCNGWHLGHYSKR